MAFFDALRPAQTRGNLREHVLFYEYNQEKGGSMTINIGAGSNQHSLTDQDAIALTSGHDFWTTESRAGIPSIRLSDGPHGLRFQAKAGDHLGLNEAAVATAFPTASASASSWDPNLLKAMGRAIAQEARHYQVDVVLGPGVNVKRNPLGGRNFEYFAEDPLLAGHLAAAWINGLQSAGVSASLKHFAGNSQETDRLRSNSLIDPVALHELYLEAFRLAVTLAQPDTVMTAYNQVNGTYMSDHQYLLNDVLRGQWGFKGLVVTDWGGLNDKVAALNAGTDLEMPSSGHLFDRQAEIALASGQLERTALTRAVSNIAHLADQSRPAGGNQQALLTEHADLAQAIAEQSAVLMKNDGLLPFTAEQPLTVIGALAADTRIQGAGSSHITTPETTSILAGLQAAGREVTYEAGYQLDGQPDDKLLQAAIAAAKQPHPVVLVVGLPDTAEAEGRDRQSLSLPANQEAVIAAVTAANPRVVVVLVAGSVVTMPWATRAAAILNVFLGGERVGAATERLLFGAISPSGKLAESYILRYSDVPAQQFGQPLDVPYRESLYVGYRYYDKAALAVAFPFGFGLSYTHFRLDNITVPERTVTAATKHIPVQVTLTNTGSCRGAEVLQVYTGQLDQAQLTPLRALAAFQKVWLAPGEQATVTLQVPRHAFERWQEAKQAFQLAGGAWSLSVGTSSRDLQPPVAITVAAPTAKISVPSWYQQPQGKPSAADFKALSGLTPQTPVARPGTFTRLSTPRTLAQYSRTINALAKVIIGNMQHKEAADPHSPAGEFLATIVWDTPLIRLAQQSGGSLKLWQVDWLVRRANHSRRRPS